MFNDDYYDQLYDMTAEKYKNQGTYPDPKGDYPESFQDFKEPTEEPNQSYGSFSQESNQFNYSSNSNSSQAEYSYGEQTYNHNFNNKEPKNKYVTKSTFIVVTIIVALLCSTIPLGAYILLTKDDNKSTGGITTSNFTLDKATGSDLTIEEIVAKNENAVVEIFTESRSNDFSLDALVTQEAGSGVIVKNNGYIVTNNHVIDGAQKINVRLKNGEEYSAQVIGADPQIDVAVIKINASNLQTAEYGDSSQLSVGQLTVVIGNPLGRLGGTATAGILSALDRQLVIDGTPLTLIQTDASINSGNSGGGMFDDKGRLVGIVVAKSKGANVEGLGFAIPINNVIPVVDDLIKHGKVKGRAMVGVQIGDFTDREKSKIAGYSEPGVYIIQVFSEEAIRAGLLEGDKVVAIEGKNIKDIQHFISKVQSYKIGEEITITIKRGNEKKDIKVVLSEKR